MRDGEIAAIARYLTGSIVDLGCGTNKVVAGSVGVDKYIKGESIPAYNGWVSCADVRADLNGVLPFKDGQFDSAVAFHVVEHLIDPVFSIREFLRITSGHLCLILPRRDRGRDWDATHIHEFLPEEFKQLMINAGLWDRVVQFDTVGNDYSFDVIFQS